MLKDLKYFDRCERCKHHIYLVSIEADLPLDAIICAIGEDLKKCSKFKPIGGVNHGGSS